MGRFTHQITSYRQQMLSVMRNEFRSIFTDAGVVLILVLALIIYATVYSMAYGAQVLRNVPIGVVDECRTPDQPQPRGNVQRRAKYVRGLQPDEHGGGQGALLQPQNIRRGLYPVGLRGETARGLAGQRGDLRRRQLLPDVPPGFPGTGDLDRQHGRDGGIPAPDRQGGGHPAGKGHDAARNLPVAQPVQPPTWDTAPSSCRQSSWSSSSRRCSSASA